MARHYLRILAMPLAALALFSLLFFGWRFLGLPETDELAVIIERWFDTYGLPVLFLSSIVEGALLVGGYFPGVFVIFIGVVLSDSVSQALAVVLVVSLGLIIAHVFNYMLGKYGWYKLLVKFGLRDAISEAQTRLEKRGPLAIFLTYWMPSLGALTDTAAGIVRLSLKIFLPYSIAATLFWSALVGTVVYIIGDKALPFVTPGSSGGIVIFVLLGIWMAALIYLDYYERHELKSKEGQQTG